MARIVETPLSVTLATELADRLGRHFQVSLGAFSSADIKIKDKRTGYTALVDVEDIGSDYDLPLSKAAHLSRVRSQVRLPVRKSDVVLVSSGNIPATVRGALAGSAVRVFAVEGAADNLLQMITSRSKESSGAPGKKAAPAGGRSRLSGTRLAGSRRAGGRRTKP